MTIKITGTRQLMTAPKGEKGEKGDPGGSVSLKGEISGVSESFPANYDKVDAEVWAVQNPFCLYYWKESVEDYVQEKPAVGDCYIVSNPNRASVDDGMLYTSDGSRWNGPYEFKGKKGDKGDKGKDGSDAWLYELKLTNAWARWTYDGGTGDWRLNCFIAGEAWYREGDRVFSAINGRYCESGSQIVQISYDNGKGTHRLLIGEDGSWSDFSYMSDDIYGESRVGYPTSIIVKLMGRNADDVMEVLDSKSIPVVWDGRPGSKGQDGNIGPMGIPAGTYSGSAKYTRTPLVCPIVEHNGEYWYPANNGTLTGSEPSATNTAWKKTENFEVMFVKILFAQFAKMGEAIFHGRFMFSQQGIHDSENCDEYQYFNPDDPDNEEHPRRFAPNLYLDFITGAARLAAGKAKFNADGSGSLAAGNFTWDAKGNSQFIGTIVASAGEFGGYIRNKFKTVDESDAEYVSEVYASVSYKLKNDLFIESGAGYRLIFPTEEKYLGVHAAIIGTHMGSRMNPNSIDIYCENGFIGCSNPDGLDVVTEFLSPFGYVELVCVRLEGKIRWFFTSIYTNKKTI